MNEERSKKWTPHSTLYLYEERIILGSERVGDSRRGTVRPSSSVMSSFEHVLA